MEISMLIMLVSFLILLALNVPIAFGLSIATLLTMLFTIDFTPAVVTMAQRMAGGINSFALLAIPFFVFSGLLMGQGGIARRLIDFAKDRKSTRLNSSHVATSYAVFCLQNKTAV